VFFAIQSTATILVGIQHSMTLTDHFLKIFHALFMVFLDVMGRGL
jgi:hypothetical protein